MLQMHKLIFCLYYITNNKCINCISKRTVIMDVSYYGHNIAVKVCYPSIDKCNFYCVWGLHLNMIYEMINNRMKFKELQFEKLEESKELITDKKDIKSNDKCYPALPVKKDKYY